MQTNEFLFVMKQQPKTFGNNLLVVIEREQLIVSLLMENSKVPLIPLELQAAGIAFTFLVVVLVQ